MTTYIQFQTLWVETRMVYVHCWLCGGFHNGKEEVRFLKVKPNSKNIKRST